MKHKKNLYYEFSDGADYSKIVMDLSECVAWIEADTKEYNENTFDDDLPMYTIKPVWLTNRQLKNLPEAD